MEQDIRYFECNNWNPWPSESKRLLDDYLENEFKSVQDVLDWIVSQKICIYSEFQDQSINYWITAPLDWFTTNFPELTKYLKKDPGSDKKFLDYAYYNYGLHYRVHLNPGDLIEQFGGRGYDFKVLKDLIENTQCCDACSDEERDSMLWYCDYVLKKGSDAYVDSRIIHDKTFALRLWNFLRATEPECPEEKSVLDKYTRFSNLLLRYQLQTVTKESEIKYFKNQR